MVRTVLHEIVIDTRAEPPEYVLRLHWQGGCIPNCGWSVMAGGSMAGPRLTM
jgi:hypothetical protein